ncbi:hypothetical protein N7509_002308 [Penicillium cosmopolitanum]|uniref:Uncharacterized protein n=1 Tax=Penicillium cosmopolitanum TaxID=1131564 RepID=A0A9W9W8K9_9EURO|nr:uncharacterized protein N7509_002308 [Penicillium cosmopolitanum]KAJ5408425.1 hypothetical protein N7509_002308 [Penicillium cosmopolitanum]
MSSNQDSSNQASVDRQYSKTPNSTSTTNMPRDDNEFSLTDLSDEELKKPHPRKSLADSITKIALNKDDANILSSQASSNRAIHHFDLQSSKIRNSTPTADMSCNETKFIHTDLSDKEAKKPHHHKSLNDSITNNDQKKYDMDITSNQASNTRALANSRDAQYWKVYNGTQTSDMPCGSH